MFSSDVSQYPRPFASKKVVMVSLRRSTGQNKRDDGAAPHTKKHESTREGDTGVGVTQAGDKPRYKRLYYGHVGERNAALQPDPTKRKLDTHTRTYRGAYNKDTTTHEHTKQGRTEAHRKALGLRFSRRSRISSSLMNTSFASSKMKLSTSPAVAAHPMVFRRRFVISLVPSYPEFSMPS